MDDNSTNKRVNHTSGHPNRNSNSTDQTNEPAAHFRDREEKKWPQVDGIEMVELGGRAPFIFLGPRGQQQQQKQQQTNQIEQTKEQQPVVASEKQSTDHRQRQRIKFRRKFSLTSMVKLKNWLPLIQLSLLAIHSTPSLIMRTRCESDIETASSQLEQQAEQLLQQLDGQSSPPEANSNSNQNNNQNQLQNELLSQLQDQLMSQQMDQQQQQQQTGSDASSDEQNMSNQMQNQLTGGLQEFSPFSNSEASEATRGELREQQSQLLDDLLESQSKAATSNSESSNAKEGDSASSGNATPTPTTQTGGSLGSPASSTGSLIGDQLSAMTNLLQQIGSQNSGLLSEAIANSVANSLVKPALNLVTNGNSNSQQQHHQHSASQISKQMAQASKTPATPLVTVQVNSGGGGGGGGSNQKNPNHNQNTRPVVGQIDGNIEYDSNNNAINGFIEFPSIPGLNLSSKPSLSSQVKPLVMAALKTVPIKLGSVGWKLLQLIAWKKVYKAHHPKSGEIIIEEEIKMPGKGSMMGHMKGGKSMGKSLDLSDLKASKMAALGKSMGSMKSSGGYMGGGGGHPMMATYGGGMGGMGDWGGGMGGMGGMGGIGGMGGMMGGMGMGMSPAMSASMIYQRHLLPPPGHPMHQQHHSQHQQQHQNQQHQMHQSQHQATAAAAAAAATAAAIQSQWVQSQLMSDAELSEREYALRSGVPSAAASNATSTSSSGGAGSASSSGGGGGSQQSPQAQASVLHRKRSSLANAGNWFAAPAQAYAAAAAAANAANMAAVAQRNQMMQPQSGGQQQAFELGPDGGFREALAGIMYQNLFDNAAAMAVQNAVKLPTTTTLSDADFLDQADSLNSGSSLSSLGSFSGATGGQGGPEVESQNAGWQQPLVNQNQLPSSVASTLGRSDAQSGGNGNGGGGQSGNEDNHLQPPASQSALMAMRDFDDFNDDKLDFKRRSSS